MTEQERLAEIEARVKDWVPLADWGPKCAGCGADEYRIDGFCSIECRDYHCDEDVAWLLEREKKLREALGCAVEELERRHPLGADPITTMIIRDSRAALADSGEASGEAG